MPHWGHAWRPLTISFPREPKEKSSRSQSRGQKTHLTASPHSQSRVCFNVGQALRQCSAVHRESRSGCRRRGVAENRNVIYTIADEDGRLLETEIRGLKLLTAARQTMGNRRLGLIRNYLQSLAG